MSQKPVNIADCLRVFGDAIMQSAHSRDQSAEVAEALFENPEIAKFLKNLRIIGYEEQSDNNGTYYGDWTCIFGLTEIAYWNLKIFPSKSYLLKTNNKLWRPETWDIYIDGDYDSIEFKTKEEMFDYVEKNLKRLGYYFSRETWK